MTASQRFIALLSYLAVLAAIWFGPTLLGLGDEGRTYFGALMQLAGPLTASICCLFAARHSADGTRLAWQCLCAAAALYLCANLAYTGIALSGVAIDFPSPPEVLYVGVSLAFALGFYHYGRDRRRVDPSASYSFATTYIAVTLSGLLILGPHLASSVLSPVGTAVAALYPSLWFAVAALGLILFLLDDHGRRSPVFALLLLAAFAEGLGDYGYALGLLGGAQDVGGAKQTLWVSSSALLAWAALEQILLSHRRRLAAAGVPSRRSSRPIRIVSASAIPGTAMLLLLVSTQLPGVVGSGLHVWLLGLLGAISALVQHKLRLAMDASRADLTRTRDQLTAVLESTSDSVLVVDHEWRVVFFNRQAAQTVKQAHSLAVGISLWELFPAALTSGEADEYFRAVETRQPAMFELFVEDRQIWLGIQAYPTPEGLSIFFRDISEQKRQRDEVNHLAHHDALTGLPNRALFQRRLTQALETGEFCAVLLLDLDHFKEVNDTLGHPIGDTLLISLAGRLTECLRAGDTVARLGGDEFGIVLRGLEGRDEAAILTERVLTATNAPQIIDGRVLRVSGSVGIAVTMGRHDRPEQLFKNADIALYAAKSSERGGFRFYDPAMAAGLDERQALRADMQAGLERQEFMLVYQPLVDLHTDRVCALEALLRWRHPVLGLVPPSQFIPIAEETGFIVELGDWVLREACREARGWPSHVAVAVNLSPRQFASGDLAGRVANILEESGLDPARLELEITETVLLRDSEANLATLGQLRSLGVRIALDDFGTGYSALGYLQRFPFSKIKIDRSFISGLPSSAGSQAIVRAVIGLGQALGMRVTAEGVETEAQLDWVRGGCDEAQGYLLSRPLPARAVADMIERHGGWTADQQPQPRRQAG